MCIRDSIYIGRPQRGTQKQAAEQGSEAETEHKVQVPLQEVGLRGYRCYDKCGLAKVP